MTTVAEPRRAIAQQEAPPSRSVWETACGYARNFLDNRFVYVLVSPRAHGLSVGINLNPDKRCNFDCVYCEVNRAVPPRDSVLDVATMVRELEQTLLLARDNRLQALPGFHNLPSELLQLRHVALSGDGEPTLSPSFAEVVRAVVHLRALGRFPFFKLVLISNATGLDTPAVRSGLQLFTPKDEIWLKLEAGTRAYYERINRPTVPLEKVLENILVLARQRPVVIQSLFPRFCGEEPPEEEITEFVARLRELRDAGAKIAAVQVYSAMRAIIHPECGHLPLRSLSRIAQAVRAGTDLPVEVF
ncbi:MAG: radical SAM protein [Verrucomicrobia bacterium]|jgi:wyosine [tRNA(Phe)-imidazoG37] synthetase (radical SAM superfamily)|nr:radical SAM protein [Verrucomicrobiota bacterium]